MKNILYAINAIKKCVGNITYDIYGPIEDQDYWEKCAELISTLPENVNVQYMGVLDPSKVSEVYTQYDIFLSPTLGENFGHSIFEGMSAGCVPVISDRTPWRELEKKQIGWDISLDQVDKFTDVINKLVLMEDAEFSKIRNKLLCYSNRKYVELNNVQGLLDMFRRDEENTK